MAADHEVAGIFYHPDNCPPMMVHEARPCQGLTLVHFSAQLKRILWDRSALWGGSVGVEEVSGGIKEYQGVFRVYFVSETAQVELRSGRVQAPALRSFPCLLNLILCSQCTSVPAHLLGRSRLTPC